MPRDLPTGTFTLVILALGAVSFLLSVILVGLIVRLAPRLGFVDRPGGRKGHAGAMPLGGGIGIFLAVAIPMLAVVGFILIRGPAFERGQRTTIVGSVTAPDPAYWSGAREKAPLAIAIIGAMAAMHLLGLADDRKALGPYIKLVLQLTIITALVCPFKELRILSAADSLFRSNGVVPGILAVLWIGTITNAFNFLDNMDGLSAGVGAVCTTAFLAATLSIHQWFVAATLATLLGSLLGFLWWNFPPARIFMGDAGSLIIGLMLGVLTVLTTYLPPGVTWGAGWYDVFAPVIVLALPLYDLIVVSAIRIARGKSPFVGDANHFSHRLVRMGLSKRGAVLCLYLVSAATAVAAIVLPHVTTWWAAVLIFAQTLMILGVIALLELRPTSSQAHQR